MDNRFKFEEEFDEVAIAIDFSEVLAKESILYSVTKRLIDIVGSFMRNYFIITIIFNCCNTYKVRKSKGKSIFAQERNGKYPKTLKCTSLEAWYIMQRIC